ncbi:MAG TPA: TonB-dependent receptor [Acidobacteriaceae bacterium]|nr:TonB-dependent receptor [Acidobacteriaceae bacterium]
MLQKLLGSFALLFALTAPLALASTMGQVQGIVHDPQHRPIAGAHIALRAIGSDLSFTAQSNGDGYFSIPAVQPGIYTITIASQGFADLQQTLTVTSNGADILHFPMEIAAVRQSAEVHAEAQSVNVDSVTPETMVTRAEIEHTPGAGRTNSMAMVTDFTPGAYMTHDMLHMRGGHELNWMIDGVPIPNTNIASNVAPQVDPRDIDTLEVDRGSYNADVGDRTYGMFNVLPNTGFQMTREGELVTTIGSFAQTDDQLSLGNHTERFAWYAALNGDRSDYGLMAPIEKPDHDASNGYGGFTSLIDNRDPRDQLRFAGQLRTDYYQIPDDPNASDWENQLYDSSGLRDGEHETDGYGIFSWVRTLSPASLFEISPFYHFNDTNYQPNPNDQPTATSARETGQYVGAQAYISSSMRRNALKGGLYGYEQHENDVFGTVFNDGSSSNFSVNPIVTGGVEEAFIEDNFRPTSWLTLIGGERQSHFAASITENAWYPRIGAAVQIPKLNWVFRGFYGHFYQPPPLTSIVGPALQYALTNQESFVPLRGERDEEHQFGLQIPLKGWLLDADTFETRANNFLDHNNIGESSVFIPITVQGAKINGWELTIHSPRLWRYGQAHLAYSNQLAQQIGPITGGLICYDPSDPAFCPSTVSPGYSALDHDQRNTLNVGFDGNLPSHIYGSFNVYYGSGFSNGYTAPPSPYTGNYLPGHTTADLAAGKSFGETWSADVNVTNVANTRVLLDNSLTFGGFHENDPRQIYGEVRYRFHF